MVEATEAMVAYFEERTRFHIERVRECLSIVSVATGFDLSERSEMHDASKFVEPERTPYIWLTEYRRCQALNEAFHYPDGMEIRVHDAIRHHVASNRHHPEFHQDPNAMSDIDLIEMVCDWTAMALERGNEMSSARFWADRTIGVRMHLNDDRREFVYKIIAILDSHYHSTRQ